MVSKQFPRSIHYWEKSRNPNQCGLKKLFNRRNRYQNNSAIYINKGSDNNQADTLNFEIRVLRTSKRHKRVPATSKNYSLW
jgi:hypothetical protein